MKLPERIEDWNFIDMLQILELDQRTGEIKIFNRKNKNKCCCICIKKGEIVEAKYGDVNGEEALKEILQMKEKNFEFIPRARIKGEMRLKLSSILLNWAYRERKKEIIKKLKKAMWEQ